MKNTRLAIRDGLADALVVTSAWFGLRAFAASSWSDHSTLGLVLYLAIAGIVAFLITIFTIALLDIATGVDPKRKHKNLRHAFMLLGFITLWMLSAYLTE